MVTEDLGNHQRLLVASKKTAVSQPDDPFPKLGGKVGTLAQVGVESALAFELHALEAARDVILDVLAGLARLDYVAGRHLTPLYSTFEKPPDGRLSHAL